MVLGGRMGEADLGGVGSSLYARVNLTATGVGAFPHVHIPELHTVLLESKTHYSYSL